MTEAAGARTSVAHRAAILAIFLIAIAPIVTTTVLPMIDFYNHLARYFVLAHLDGDPFLSANYQSHWAILPNIGLDVIGTGLMRVMDPLLTAHVILVTVFGVQYFGILFFNRQVTGRSSLIVAILTVPLLYSFIFTWGFANFLLGLGLVFWAAGLRIALRDRPRLALLWGCIFATVIFVTHGVAFALYGLLAGTLEIGMFLTSRPRRLPVLARNLALLALQAVVPAILFLASSTSKAADGISNADEAVRRLADHGELLDRLSRLFIYRLTTILRVAESPVAWFDVLSLALAAAILLALFLRGRLRVAPQAWPAIALGALLIVVVPPTLFGVGYVADRMPLFAAFVLLGSLSLSPGADRFQKFCTGALVILVGARLLLISMTWQANHNDLREFERSASAIPRESLVGYVDAANTSRLGVRPRCEMYGPLLVLLDRQASTLFAFGTQQPMQLKGHLAKAVDSLPKVEAAKRVPADRVHVMLTQRLFDYVMVCDAERLTRPLPVQTRVVSHNGRFTVLRATPPGPPAT